MATLRLVTSNEEVRRRCDDKKLLAASPHVYRLPVSEYYILRSPVTVDWFAAATCERHGPHPYFRAMRTDVYVYSYTRYA